MSFLNEKQVELKLVTETRKKGGLAVKFVSPSFSGMPEIGWFFSLVGSWPLWK